MSKLPRLIRTILSMATLVVLVPGVSSAQIAGVVNDSVTGLPVAGATVILWETGDTVTTDVNGNYYFASGPTNQFTVLVGFTGYGPGQGVFTTCLCTCTGDPQCDGVTNVLDVVQTVNVAFRGFPSTTDPDCTSQRTDLDCNGITNVLDVVRIVNVTFRGFDPALQVCNPCGP